MKKQKMLSPDPPPAGGTPPPVSHKPGIPAGDVDFMAVADAVQTKWKTTAAITLVWTDADAFKDLVLAYIATLTGRLTTGGGRSVFTNTLENLDNDIHNAVNEVKTYIAEKYGSQNATAYYAQFGITHVGSHWDLPTDHSERNQKLSMMGEAITANGFSAKTYGTAFWTATKTAYNDALTGANNTDGSVSAAVGTKNQQKAQINKVMVALRYVLRGNYPDTYAEVYRDWGWQKEDY